jgi:hypothetical protein
MSTPKTHEKPYFPALGHVSARWNSLTSTPMGGSRHATDHTTNRHGFKVFFGQHGIAPTFADITGLRGSPFPSSLSKKSATLRR